MRWCFVVTSITKLTYSTMLSSEKVVKDANERLTVDNKKALLQT